MPQGRSVHRSIFSEQHRKTENFILAGLLDLIEENSYPHMFLVFSHGYLLKADQTANADSAWLKLFPLATNLL
jgi:hypothetical protein